MHSHSLWVGEGWEKRLKPAEREEAAPSPFTVCSYSVLTLSWDPCVCDPCLACREELAGPLWTLFSCSRLLPLFYPRVIVPRLESWKNDKEWGLVRASEGQSIIL